MKLFGTENFPTAIFERNMFGLGLGLANTYSNMFGFGLGLANTYSRGPRIFIFLWFAHGMYLLQRRIQDFPEGSTNLLFGKLFFQKVHENARNWAKKGASLVSSWIPTALGITLGIT